jgi:hypothetical protein
MAYELEPRGYPPSIKASARPSNERHIKTQSLVRSALVTGAALVGFTTVFAGSVAASPLPRSSSSISAAKMHALVNVEATRINAIRTSFGLSPGQITTAYNSEVVAAVRTNADPPFAPAVGGIVGESGLWGILPGASGANAQAPLTLVNGWVYHDGWNGSVAATWNLDCTSASAAACNGHRRSVLSRPPVAGAQLYIDVTTSVVNFHGSPSVAVAALMVWKMP